MFLEKNKSSLVAVILIILSLGLAVKPAMSVNPNFSHFGMQTKYYHVQDGDNLWNLSGKLYGDPNLWKKLADENGLSKKVFKGPQGPYTKDQEYCPLDKSLVLVYYTFDDKIVDTTSVDTAKADTVVAPPVPLQDSKETPAWWNNWWWLYLLIFTGLMIAIGRWLNKRKVKNEADPVGSGQPQVEGGVDEAHALQRVQNIANANGINPLRVTNIQKGRFYGRARVYYADKPLGLMKRFDGEDGYRGIVLRTNGEEQTIYFLQGCGNDARVGNFMTGIRFVANEIQPTEFVNHNQENQIPIEVPTTETTNTTSLTPAPKPFNWQEEYLKIIDKAVDGDKKIFFEVTVGSAKVRFNSTGKNPTDTQQSK